MCAAEQTDPIASRVRLPPHVVYRSFVDETVLLNLKTGRYHGLNRSAGRILETLDELSDVDRAVERLALDFGQPPEMIRHDVDVFCRDLLQRDLIELDGGDG